MKGTLEVTEPSSFQAACKAVETLVAEWTAAGGDVDDLAHHLLDAGEKLLGRQGGLHVVNRLRADAVALEQRILGSPAVPAAEALLATDPRAPTDPAERMIVLRHLIAIMCEVTVVGEEPPDFDAVAARMGLPPAVVLRRARDAADNAIWWHRHFTFGQPDAS